MSIVRNIKKWLEKPVRFDYMDQYLIPGASVLDIGCGSKAPYSTLSYYPTVLYSGVDYADIEGAPAMEHFYQCNLEDNDLSVIPNDTFDIVILSHIIEHVTTGERLITILLSKLKSGGVIYIETPSERSLELPSHYGTFNFYDDPTHKKLYTLSELNAILEGQNCIIVRSGIRHHIKRIVLFPFYAVHSLIRDRKLNAAVLWDIVGFAHYVIAKKR